VRALVLAEREGHVRVFLETGGALSPVLRYCIDQGIAAEWCEKLLAARGEQAKIAGEGSDGGEPALLEPLSERELEVLQLVADGLSNEAIAAQLFLAVGTVKRH
jgi:LuxR family maltose regulon positive regulatory protein